MIRPVNALATESAWNHLTINYFLVPLPSLLCNFAGCLDLPSQLALLCLISNKKPLHFFANKVPLYLEATLGYSHSAATDVRVHCQMSQFRN